MEFRRSSRADRRKRTGTYTGEERRRPVPSTVTIYSQVTGAELQIFVQNPIIADNCTNAKEALLKHAQRSMSPVVVADLSKATYIDTPGLSTLFEVKRQVNAQGRAFYLQNPSRCVQRMLNITRMVRVFPIRFTTLSDVQAIPTAKSAIPLPGDDEQLLIGPGASVEAQADDVDNNADSAR